MEELRCLCSFQALEDISVGAATVPAARTNADDDLYPQSHGYVMWSWQLLPMG